MFKSHLQAVNWCDVLHMVTLCLNENKLTANEKGFCKTGRGNLLNCSAPKWLLWATKKKKEASKPKHTHHGNSRGVWYFMETSETKWFPGNCLGLLQRKRSLLHIAKEEVWVCLFSAFSQAWETELVDTFNTSPSSLSLSLLT